MIFNLPNGLQGYALADARGNRLEAAPTEIVTDKFAEDKTVRNGLSLHPLPRPRHEALRRRGPRRRSSGCRAAPVSTRRQVLQLYPGQAEMDRLLKEDAERFATALRQALGKPPVREPLIPVTQRFLEEPLRSRRPPPSWAWPARRTCETSSARPRSPALGLSPLATEGIGPARHVGGLLRPGRPGAGPRRADRPARRADPPRLPAGRGGVRREAGDQQEEQRLRPGRRAGDHRGEPLGQGRVHRADRDQREGEKVILAPSPTRVRPGQQYRFPPEGAIKVRGGLGKEQITVFASDAAFPPGELLAGPGRRRSGRPPVRSPGSPGPQAGRPRSDDEEDDRDRDPVMYGCRRLRHRPDLPRLTRRRTGYSPIVRTTRNRALPLIMRS